MDRASSTALGVLRLVRIGLGHSAELEIGGGRRELNVVLNPFGKAIQDGVDLNALLHDDPDGGNAKLDAYVAAARAEIEAAPGEICYVLEGASAEHCSPMQYGGFYLERDRELLDFARVHRQDADATVLYVAGDDSLYLDFVSDLPADIFAWDAIASGFDSDYVRGLREGKQASNDPNSEIQLMIEMTSSDAGANVV